MSGKIGDIPIYLLALVALWLIPMNPFLFFLLSVVGLLVVTRFISKLDKNRNKTFPLIVYALYFVSMIMGVIFVILETY